MSSETDFAFDYFISRRGNASQTAIEVARVLEHEGYRVKIQDHDFSLGGDFVGDIHDALVAARHLFVLHTADYDQNYWTRKEFTNFLACLSQSQGTRRICMLRCDESLPRGILANVVFGDLCGVTDAEARRQIILAAAKGGPLQIRSEPHIFGGTMPKKNSSFTGRTSILAIVESRMRAELSSSALCVVAICGLAGTGKTSIARACVDALGPDYAAVWWLQAQSRQDIVSGLGALGARFDPQLAQEADVEKVARAALARIERSERPLLMVFDNVNDPGAIDEFLPARGAHVLVTSRHPDWHGRAHEIAIDVMDEEEAVSFLQARAGRRDDEAGARRLARVLGCLPLALDHAGAYVRLAMSSFDAYAKNIDKLLVKAPKNAPHPASVAATFTLAIENAIAEVSAADAVLGPLAFFAPERIPLKLVPAMPEEERSEALMALTGVSLVRSDPLDNDVPGISLHRLVQSAARLRLVALGRVASALDQAIGSIAEAFPTSAYEDPQTWPDCEQLLAHALAIRGHAATLGARAPMLPILFDRVGQFLHARATFELAEELFRDAIVFGDTCCGSDSLEVARSKNNLANVLNAVGRRNEVEPLLRESLAVQEEKLGRDDPGFARTTTSLAWFLHETGRYAESEQLLCEAIASGERTLGRSHPDVAVRINNLALCLQLLGRLDEAEELLREAIKAGEQSLGRTHPLVLTRLNNLASLLERTGRLAEAEQLFREAIESGATSLGRKHPDIAVRLANLANILRDQGRWDAAEPMYREALETCELNYGPDHPLIGRIRRNLAVLQLATGHAEDALGNARRALAVHEKMFGRAHSWTRDSAETYALSVERLGRLDEATSVRSSYELPAPIRPVAAS